MPQNSKPSTTAGAVAGLVVGTASLVCFTFGWITPPGVFGLAGGGNLLSLILNIAVFIVVSLCTKKRPASIINKIQSQYDDFFAEKDFD